MSRVGDRIVGSGSAPGIADKIDGSELFVYPGLGHGAYEEAKDFTERVLDFWRDNSENGRNVIKNGRNRIFMREKSHYNDH